MNELNYLQQHVEALIFCATEPVSADELQKCLNEMFQSDIPIEDIFSVVSILQLKYSKEDFVFEILPIAGGYQFMTKPSYQASISLLLKNKNKKRLSSAALETLSIIAYRQPVTKSQIEQIRGVNCDYAVQKLLERELIELRGKADLAGRPVLYATSRRFMEHFGLNSLKDLPAPKDIGILDETLFKDESLNTESIDTV